MTMRFKLNPWTVVLYLSFTLSALAHETPETRTCSLNNDHLLLATLWNQTSGEFKALSYQAYKLSGLLLDQALKQKEGPPLAVVVDVDDTVLDNSPYQAKVVLENINYPTAWKDWVLKASADALPGSVDFLRYADSKYVEIFYISNRKLDEVEATYNNLKALDFPVKKENLLFRDKDSNKEERRQKIAKNYQIELLIGDNLNDFAGVFEKKSAKERSTLTDLWKEEFGRKFIVLPNPMYGDWENSLFEYRALSLEEKDELRRKALRSF